MSQALPILSKNRTNAKHFAKKKEPPLSIKEKQWLNQNNFQYKIMPQDSSIATDIMIYDNKFIQISYTQEIHAVVIESTGIADTQKALFKIIWNNCK